MHMQYEDSDNAWFGSGYSNQQYGEGYGDYRGGGYHGNNGPQFNQPSRGPGPMNLFERPHLPNMFGLPGTVGPIPGYRRGQQPKSREHRAIGYLIRCGVPRHQVKGLPKDLLDLIQPQYCGLCGQNFDSIEISKIHYVSKNHQKSQKKWLSHASDNGPSSFQEVPLKSRDLYCELCDVQITSKVHADSHYSGKSHRAIVEERKLPKNPMLLQPSKEKRLKQLIRREKRFITDEPYADEPEAKDVPDKPKTTQPELTCNICKTSMTCSEQMTAHLNGKRHLAKEKQHILKAMKGELSEETSNGGKAEAASVAETNDQGLFTRRQNIVHEEYGEGEGDGEGAGEGEGEGKLEDWQDTW